KVQSLPARLPRLPSPVMKQVRMHVVSMSHGTHHGATLKALLDDVGLLNRRPTPRHPGPDRTVTDDINEPANSPGNGHASHATRSLLRRSSLHAYRVPRVPAPA